MYLYYKFVTRVLTLKLFSAKGEYTWKKQLGEMGFWQLHSKKSAEAIEIALFFCQIL